MRHVEFPQKQALADAARRGKIDAVGNLHQACRAGRVCYRSGMVAKIKLGVVYLLAAFFFLAGISHFVSDDAFAQIVPPLLPFPYVIVWVTGVMEIAMAVMLLCPHFRARVGMVLAVFLLCVLPANIYMAMAGIGFGDSLASPTALWVRVALQFPLIALVLWATRRPPPAKPY